ncbi:EF hand [Trypanosoma cruzi]|nr:EF hand [Trypanosoma cruzi]
MADFAPDGASASRYFQSDSNFGECGVCLCQWVCPLEIFPCRHIFCEACVESVDRCPECSASIEQRRRPNVAILELQKHSKGRCSVCGWVGTFENFNHDHVTCNAKPSFSSSSLNVSSTSPPLGSRVGRGYMLDRPETNDAGQSSPDFSSQQEQQQKQQEVRSRASSPKLNANALRPVSSISLSAEGIRRWKETVSCVASDYGLSEDEFKFMRDIWPEFATLNSTRTNLELQWCDACRMLRYMNLPSHPNDVIDLFNMAMQPIEGGFVSFESVCLWSSVYRRDPIRMYNMNRKEYSCLLKYAQIIDIEKTGLFNEDQCRGIGEQMLLRELTDLEWRSIRPLVVARAEEFRGNIPCSYPTAVSQVQQMKLSLHEIILLYNRFFDPTKKSTGMAGSNNNGLSEALLQRIQFMLMH